jgi:hypothetical protein
MSRVAGLVIETVEEAGRAGSSTWQQYVAAVRGSSTWQQYVAGGGFSSSCGRMGHWISGGTSCASALWHSRLCHAVLVLLETKMVASQVAGTV